MHAGLEPIKYSIERGFLPANRATSYFWEETMRSVEGTQNLNLTLYRQLRRDLQDAGWMIRPGQGLAFNDWHLELMPA